MANKKAPKPAKPVVRAVKLIDITVEDDIQSRDVTDNPDQIASRIEEYRGVIRGGKKFNKLPVVYEDKGAKKIWLSEGFLRHQAHIDERKTRMECEVRQGTRLDALLNSAGSNQGHGLYRRNSDKRRSVEMVLKACPNWSNRRIASQIGVSDPFVMNVRHQVLTLSTSEREGADGKIYTVVTKVQENAPLPAPPPDCSPVAKAEFDTTEPTVETEDNSKPAESTQSETKVTGGETLSAPPMMVPASVPPSTLPAVQFHRTPDGAITGGPVPLPGEAGAPPTDQLGRPLPAFLIPLFEKRPVVKRVNQSFVEAMRELKRLDKDDAVGGFLKRRAHFEFGVGLVTEFLRIRAAPFCVCPACTGDGDSERCPTCGGKGWLSRAGYEQLVPEMLVVANEWGGTPDDPAPDRAEWTSAEWAASGRDALGNTIPPKLRDTFACDAILEGLRQLKALVAMLDGAKGWLHYLKAEAHATGAQYVRYVEDSIPFAVCVNCDGKGCGKCELQGYHPKWAQEAGRNNIKREKKAVPQ